VDASVFGSPTAGAPVRVSVMDPSTGHLTIYSATNRVSNTLTVTAIEGTSDQNFPSGSTCACLITAGSVSDLNILKADLASPTFSGILTVTAPASTEYGLVIKSANTGAAYGWFIGQGYPGSYDGDLLIGKTGVGRVLKVDSFGLELMTSGSCVTFRQPNTGIQANHGHTRLITPDGSLNWIFGAQGQLVIQIAGNTYATLTTTGWQYHIAPKFPGLADASIPNTGIAWSSTHTNVLKYRTSSGALCIVPGSPATIIQPDENVTTITANTATSFVYAYTNLNDIVVTLPLISDVVEGHEIIVKNFGATGHNVTFSLPGSDAFELGAIPILTPGQWRRFKASKAFGQWVFCGDG